MKKIFFASLFFRYVLVEIIFMSFLFTLIFISCYSLFLHDIILKTQNMRQIENKLIRIIHKKEKITENEKAIRQQLQQWKHKHPTFYTALTTFTSEKENDFITKTISQLLQTNGFTILAIKTIQNDDHLKNKSTINTVFTIKGSFQSLLFIYNAINQLSYPITISKLIIHRASVFHLQISWQK